MRFMTTVGKPAVLSFEGDTLITRSWAKRGGNLINTADDEIHAVFYDASWDGGSNPYRALAVSRPGGTSYLTDLYESADGLSWSLKNSDVLGDAGNTDTYRAVKRAVYDSANTRYIMMYLSDDDGINEDIGLATSSDLDTWSDQGSIMTPGTSPSPNDVVANFCSGLCIVGNTLYMMVDECESTDADYRIALYHASLSDLTSWTRDGLKIEADASIAWKASETMQGFLAYSSLDSKYIFFYTGDDGTETHGVYRIGLATADTIDGEYTDYPQNPIIEDGIRIGEPCLFDDTAQSGEWRLYYRYWDGADYWSKVARFTEA